MVINMESYLMDTRRAIHRESSCTKKFTLCKLNCYQFMRHCSLTTSDHLVSRKSRITDYRKIVQFV